MKLIRQIPSTARQVASGMTLTREFVFCYVDHGEKYIKIVTPKRSYCYKGHDCF